MSSFPNLSPNSWHWLYLDMSKDCWQLAFSYFFLVVVIFFSFNGISCSHNACSLIVLDQNLFFEANYISQYSSSSSHYNSQCSSMNFWCSKSINISFEMLWYVTIVLITIGMISIFTQYLVSPFSGSSRYSPTLFFLSAPWSWDIKTHKIPSLAFFFHCYIWSIVFDPSINFYISQYLAIFLSWSWYFLLYMLLSFFDAAITYFLAIFHWTVLPTASCLTLFCYLQDYYNHLLLKLLLHILSGRSCILAIYPMFQLHAWSSWFLMVGLLQVLDGFCPFFIYPILRYSHDLLAAIAWVLFLNWP